MTAVVETLGAWHTGPALRQQVADAVGQSGEIAHPLWALWQEGPRDARPVILLSSEWSAAGGRRVQQLLGQLSVLVQAGLHPTVVRLSPEQTAEARTALLDCLVTGESARPAPLQGPLDLSTLDSRRLAQHTAEVAALSTERLAHVSLSASRAKRDVDADWADRGWPSASPALDPTPSQHRAALESVGHLRPGQALASLTALALQGRAPAHAPSPSVHAGVWAGWQVVPSGPDRPRVLLGSDWTDEEATQVQAAVQALTQVALAAPVTADRLTFAQSRAAEALWAPLLVDRGPASEESTTAAQLARLRDALTGEADRTTTHEDRHD